MGWCPGGAQCTRARPQTSATSERRVRLRSRHSLPYSLVVVCGVMETDFRIWSVVRTPRRKSRWSPSSCHLERNSSRSPWVAVRLPLRINRATLWRVDARGSRFVSPSPVAPDPDVCPHLRPTQPPPPQRQLHSQLTLCCWVGSFVLVPSKACFRTRATHATSKVTYHNEMGRDTRIYSFIPECMCLMGHNGIDLGAS